MPYYIVSIALGLFPQMRDLSHENINPFVGACVDPPNICVIYNFCSKGSLQVIIHGQIVLCVLKRLIVKRYT